MLEEQPASGCRNTSAWRGHEAYWDHRGIYAEYALQAHLTNVFECRWQSISNRLPEVQDRRLIRDRIASKFQLERARLSREPTSDQWRRHWSRCIVEAAAADITLTFAQEGERQMGALVEAGACRLGAGQTALLG